jgi:hypothetical protein
MRFIRSVITFLLLGVSIMTFAAEMFQVAVADQTITVTSMLYSYSGLTTVTHVKVICESTVTTMINATSTNLEYVTLGTVYVVEVVGTATAASTTMTSQSVFSLPVCNAYSERVVATSTSSVTLQVYESAGVSAGRGGSVSGVLVGVAVGVGVCLAVAALAVLAAWGRGRRVVGAAVWGLLRGCGWASV